jgi:hypothetical protein
MARIQGFNFQPIVAPFTSLPVEQFGATTGLLNQRYDQSLDLLSKHELAQSSIKAVQNGYDNELLNEINGEFNLQFDGVKQKGDYENQLSKLKLLTGDYLSKVAPIQQKYTEYDKLVQQIYADKNIINKDQAVQALRLKDSSKPSLIRDDNGRVYNNFDTNEFSFIYNPEVNLQERALSIASKMKAQIFESFPQLNQIKDKDGLLLDKNTPLANILETITTQNLGADKIRATLKLAFEGDPEIQAHLQKLEEYEKLGVEGVSKDQFINQAIEAAVMSQAQNNVTRTTQILNTVFDKNKGGSGEENPVDVDNNVSFLGESISVDNVKSIKELNTLLNETNDQLKNDVNNPYLSLNKSRLQYIKGEDSEIIDFVKQDKTLDSTDKQILDKLKKYQLEDVKKSFGFFAGTFASKEENEKIEQIRQDLFNDLSLPDRRKVTNIISLLENKQEQIFKERTDELSKSAAPEVMMFNDPKLKEGKTVREKITQKVLTPTLDAYTIYGSDGKKLNEQILQKIEKNKEFLKENLKGNPTANQTVPNFEVVGLTRSPLPNTNQLGIVVNLSAEFQPLFGGTKQIYLQPNSTDNTIINEIVKDGLKKTQEDNIANITGYLKLRDFNSVRFDDNEKIFGQLSTMKPSMLPDSEKPIIFKSVDNKDINLFKTKDKNGNDLFTLWMEGMPKAIGAYTANELRDNFYNLYK